MTSNVADFKKLAAARELHSGLVLVVDGDLLRVEQEEVLVKAVSRLRKELEVGRDLVNRVLYIGRQTEGTFEDLPPALQVDD